MNGYNWYDEWISYLWVATCAKCVFQWLTLTLALLYKATVSVFHCYFRITVKAYCPMNLEDFPMDKQRCPITIESCKSGVSYILHEH